MTERRDKIEEEDSMTGKRVAEESLRGTDGARGESESGKKPRKSAADEEEEPFLGPELGDGPRWRLRAGTGAEAELEGDGALFRCRAMLDQALSCSGLADVRFLFDDGRSLVSGHRGMLCSVSSEFLGMFESGMMEAKTGEVRVRGVSRESFRSFLELVYLGRAGKEAALADGREVWVLADLYNVKGIKEWLMGDGLEDGSVCAALQYALEGGGFLDELLEACKRHVSVGGLGGIEEESLQGMSAAHGRLLLEAFMETKEGGYAHAGRLTEGFKYIERWSKANGGLVHGNEDVDSLVGLICIDKLPYEDLVETVRPSGLVREEQFLEILVETGKKRIVWNALGWLGEELLRGMCAQHLRELLQAFLEMEARVETGTLAEFLGCITRWAKVNGDLGCGNEDVCSLVGLIDLSKLRYKGLKMMRRWGLVEEALVVEELDLRLGCATFERKRVEVLKSAFYSLPRGVHFYKHPFAKCKFHPDQVAVSRKVEGRRIAVRDHRYGVVLVIDVESGKHVFALGHKKTFRLPKPSGLAFNHQDELIVSDIVLGKIFVFDKCGRVVREFSVSAPTGVAVNGDGEIIVCEAWSKQKHVFRADGTHVRSWQTNELCSPDDHVAVGPDGRIVTVDSYDGLGGERQIQVFEPDGSHVMTIALSKEKYALSTSKNNLAVSSLGVILVADREACHDVQLSRRCEIKLFSKEGAFLGKIGDSGLLDGLNLGVYVDDDGDGHVFVYDNGELLMIS